MTTQTNGAARSGPAYRPAPARLCPACLPIAREERTDPPQGRPIGSPGVNGWIYTCPCCEATWTEHGQGFKPGRAAASRRPPARKERAKPDVPRDSQPKTGLFLVDPDGQPKRAQPEPKVTSCRECRAPIVWIVTKNRKRMPLDVDTHVGDGVRTLVDVHGDVHAKAGPEIRGRESHFATCPVVIARRKRQAESKSKSNR